MRFLVFLALLAPASAFAQVDVDISVDVDVQLPVAASPAPAESPPAAPEVVATPAPVNVSQDQPRRSHPATLGLALLTSSSRIINGPRAMGLGASLMIHPLDRYPLDLGIDYQNDRYEQEAQRSDHRIHYTIYVALKRGTLTPYVAIPMGVIIVSRAAMPTKVEGMVGIGGGATLRLGRHWFMLADARISSRREQVSEGDMPTLPHEVVIEGRGSVGYYF